MAKDSTRFSRLFPLKPIIGMIHLKALPGAPDYDGSMRHVLDFALQDVERLERGGCDGLMVENFFDSPFFKDQVGPETVAAMARIITEVRQHTKLPIGVNALRNDGMSGIAVATACDRPFIRVNQPSCAMLSHQGVVQ